VKSNVDSQTLWRSAFVDTGPLPVRPAEDGPLAGLTFAVKDLFDIAGVPTGCGNPERAQGDPAVATASSVQALLGAGATCVGKTHTDEFALGMFGTNPHFGTPINPAAPDRLPGGSSSGSAAAVAGGLVDFALGTDTGASVRLPASFCGTFGIRTSHGRISTAGVVPMGPSFDTVGWFARDATIMRRIGEVYFGEVRQRTQPRYLIATDAFALAVESVRRPLLDIAARLNGREVMLCEDGFEPLVETFGTLQLQDLWATLGVWVAKPGRTVGSRVRDRVEIASRIPASRTGHALHRREAWTRQMASLLGHDGILVLPTAHDIAPLRDAPPSALEAFRSRTLALTCIAGLARLPQISLPIASVDGCPVGLSLVGGWFGDEHILATAEELWMALRT
jgi:amidase